MPSLLRPWPRSSTRVRAANAEGTSNTLSPAATSCWASSRPRPPAPSMAQTRCGHCAAHAVRRPSIARSAGTRSSPSVTPLGSSATAVCELLWGSMPMVITSGSSRPARRDRDRGGQPEFEQQRHASIEPRQRRAATARHAMRQPRDAGKKREGQHRHRPRRQGCRPQRRRAHPNKSEASCRVEVRDGHQHPDPAVLQPH